VDLVHLLILLGLKGSVFLEKKLFDLGGVKPANFSDFTSFLIWAKKYGVDLKIYIEDFKISKGLLRLFYRHENISKNKQRLMKQKIINQRKKIIGLYKNKINILKKSHLSKIDELLNKGYVVAFTMADKLSYFGFKVKPKEDFLLSHWRVVYKKSRGKYLIKDSKFGAIKLSKKDMKRQLNNIHKDDQIIELIAFKKN